MSKATGYGWITVYGRNAILLSSVRAHWWVQQRRAWSRDDEIFVKLHVLLETVAPLLNKTCYDDLDNREKAQLANAVAQTVELIKSLKIKI